MLYHYCSYDKFESIIKSKSLWLTQIVKSNDTEEVKRTFEIIWKQIRDKVADGIKEKSNSDEIMSLLDNQMETDLFMSTSGDETPYGVCLSVNRDLAQNWNEYGDRSQGVALVFSKELFAGINRQLPHPNANFNSAIGWEQVYYDRNQLGEQVSSLFIDMLKNDVTGIGWLNVRTTLKHYSAFVKNHTFQDEREIRIIYYPRKEHGFNSTTELTQALDSIPSHCVLPWLKSNGICALTEIIIGTNCKHSEDEIRTLLKDNGIDNEIKITKSEYPYRISENR